MSAYPILRYGIAAGLPGAGLAWVARLLGVVAWIISIASAPAAEVMPARPPNHFNDFAGIVSRDVAAELNRELDNFERETSNQLVVAIYPRMQSDSSVEDYTVRVAQRWGVGQRDRRNGAVLFVFQESRDVRIVTGYGLEGALPDALAKQIIENEIVPRFRTSDFNGGLTAGVRAMIAAVRGEYRGTGATRRDAQATRGGPTIGLFGFTVIALILITLMRARSRRNVVFDRRGRHAPWIGPGTWGGGGWSSGGWMGGGHSSGGGGTFSAGGGTFGGGGAGGKW